MKIFCLLNPSRDHAYWKDCFAKTGLPRGWVNRELADGLERMVRSGLQAGIEKFVVLGGDGTFHRVLNVLAQEKAWKTTLELVPGGTCNDFARYLYGKKFLWQPDKACQVHELDVASINGRYFLNNAGFGRRPALGDKRSAWAAALKFQAVPVKVRWNDGSLEGSFWMGMACNAPFFNRGLFFSPDASASDGILDFFFVRPMPIWKALARLALGRLGRPLAEKASQGQEHFGVHGPVVSFRAYQITVETEIPVWPQADGEPVMEPTKLLSLEIAREKIKLALSSESRITKPESLL